MKKRKKMNAVAITTEVATSSSLEEWLALAQSGDERAFEKLVQEFQPMVFKVALGFFRDRDEALEVLQETFIRVYRYIRQFDNPKGMNPWIYRTALNICIDRYRSRQKRGERERNLILIHPVTEAGADSPEEALEKEEKHLRLRGALEMLPERERSIFILKHFNHLKLKEIAEVLNISLGTVKSTHFRAVNHLREAVVSGGEQ